MVNKDFEALLIDIFGNYMKSKLSIRIQQKETGIGYNYMMDEFLDKDLQEFSYNGMFTPALYRKLNMKNEMENLYAVFAFGIDIDYHSMKTYRDFSPMQMYSLLEQEVLGSDIPYPNYVEYGNNLRLIYILSDPIYNKKEPNGDICPAIRLLNRVRNQFNYLINKSDKDFGADSVAMNSYFRIPGSINTKGNKVINIMKVAPYKWSLTELKDNYLMDEESFAEWKRHHKKRHFTNDVEFLNKRLSDVKTIQNHFNNNRGHTGYRNELMYVAWITLHSKLIHENKDNDKIREDMYKFIKDFNSNFKYPLPIREVESFRIPKKIMKMRTYTILNKLGISNDEARLMGLYMSGNIIDVDEKKAYNKKYYEEKSSKHKNKQIMERRNRVKELRDRNVKISEIAKICNISIATTNRDIKWIESQRKKEFPSFFVSKIKTNTEVSISLREYLGAFLLSIYIG
jgi:hypothetical protein